MNTARKRAARCPAVWHRSSPSAILAIALIAAFAVTEAQAATPVLPLPAARAETYEIRPQGRTTLVLHSLLVRRIHGSLDVRCKPNCRRYAARKVIKRRPSRSSKRFTHVNWILPRDRAVTLKVTRHGWIGRYLLLTAQRRNGRLALGYKTSGCLNGRSNRIRCPQQTPQAPPDIESRPAPLPQPQPPSPPQPPPPAVKPPPPPPPAPVVTTHTEQIEQAGSAPTFKNYHNASGRGPDVAAGREVQITCKVYDTTIQSASPGGYWYRIATAPWSDAYYSPANNFVNGGQSFDPAVNDC